MGSRPDYYRLLHVSEDAPTEVIRSSYRTLMKTLGAHPDLGGDENAARELNAAWEVLSDPAERTRFDAERALAGARDRMSGEPAPAREKASAPPPPPTTKAATAASASTNEDRRTITRLKRDAHIDWSTPDGRNGSSSVGDLSPRGLSFVTPTALGRGDTLEIRSDAFHGHAAVRNARRLSDGRHLVGVEFVDVRFHENRGTFISRSA